MASSNIPTVDLSLFSTEAHEEDTKRATKVITDACSGYGLFQIVNHGVPLSLMTRALELSKLFFELPTAEKLKSSPRDETPLPAGFNIPPNTSDEKYEQLLMYPPQSGFNLFPNVPPELRKVMEELFLHLTKTAFLVESILNDCLGLPPKFLEEYNTDTSWDLMTVWKYWPATEMGNNGLSEHQDGNCFTLVFGDENGLEVLKDETWIPVISTEGGIIVNIADIIQVLSNNKFKSAIHRVVRAQGRSRHSYAFFYNVDGNKWIEPLPEFTMHIGQPARYRAYLSKDYQQARIRNKIFPPSRPEDFIDITHFAIPE